MAKLKIRGIWIGMLEVELETWTITRLREEVAKQSNCNPDSINLIYAGKILKDGDGQHNLIQIGIKNNAKVLATRMCVEQGKTIKEKIVAEEERSNRLARVKAAATALAQRHADGLLPIGDINIEVENQSGNRVQLASETDQRAIMTGLMLAASGKRLIRQGKYKDALEILIMGEEAFSLCDPKALELIDNIPILQINMVWCYFMMQDISSLSEAGKRLEMAREGLERAHGKHALRIRLLQGGRYPELALHLRLELLEGVVAYYSGRLDRARAALLSAQAKFEKLQVSDEALSLIISMGFNERDAKRALKMNGQHVGAAVDFLIEDKAKKEQKQKEEIQRKEEIWMEKAYGLTPLKKSIDLQRLTELESVGFGKEVAAEALRRNENDIQKALDDLTHPQTISDLQAHVESRKRIIRAELLDSSIDVLVQMGFERARAAAAIEAEGNIFVALPILIAERMAEHNMQGELNSSAGPSVGASSSASPLPQIASVGDVQGPSNLSETQKRDVEMEGELSADIAESDALADYDIEVNIEGEAIAEYLSLVESAAGSKGKEKGENDSVE